MAHAVGPAWAVGVQLRLPTSLSLAEYVAAEEWRHARLERCPLHIEGGCGFARHGSYPRKEPEALGIARYYCRGGQTTFGLLPDFLASRLRGTLDDVEQAVVAAETSENLEAAADLVRPDALEVTLVAAQRWVSRRVRMFAAVLLALAGPHPELLAGGSTLTGLRGRLGTESALVELRRIAAAELGRLPPPFGFGPRPLSSSRRARRRQQSVGSIRPP